MSLMDELMVRFFKAKQNTYDDPNADKIYFSDLLRIDSGGREYEEIRDINKLQTLLENKCTDYNMENSNRMDLVFFRDCIEHILRVSRVLR